MENKHWAAKYLPGKAPVGPEHNIAKFSNVVSRFIQQGQKDIACVCIIVRTV